MDAHYHDTRLVEIYDRLNENRSDFNYYRQQLPRPPCWVLDIGCGTGTFSLDLARSGYGVTAVDPAPKMIDCAASKPGSDAVEWICGELSKVDRKDVFDVAIMTGHAFQCVLTDRDIKTLFRDVACRLKPGGSFWFETRNPLAKTWELWTPQHVGPPVPLANGTTVQVTHNVVRLDEDCVTFSESYTFHPTNETVTSVSTLRFVTRALIERYAQDAGFEVATVKGDWDGSPFTEQSPEIIVELRAPPTV